MWYSDFGHLRTPTKKFYDTFLLKVNLYGSVSDVSSVTLKNPFYFERGKVLALKIYSTN